MQLCERAYADDGIATLISDFESATHVMLLDVLDKLICHELWVDRPVIYVRQPLQTAYVELVATDPDHQHQGHATRVMRALGTAIASFDIGALSPSDPVFYARLGWELWRGSLLEQQPDGSIAPSSADETVMVLQLPHGPELGLAAPMTAPWRRGEIW